MQSGLQAVVDARAEEYGPGEEGREGRGVGYDYGRIDLDNTGRRR
jgi:hypothetical protein